jgi:hypothetical protein
MYDKLAILTKQLIERWTAKSPQAYRSITDIAFGLGLITTAITLSPFTLPIWFMPVSAFIIALCSKLTVENPNQSNKH